LEEKIVCPIYWQQSLWVSKGTGSVVLRPGGVMHCCATIKPKGTTEESKVLCNGKYGQKDNADPTDLN